MENKNHIIIINGSPRRSKNCSKIIDNITKKLDDNNIKYEVLNIYKMNIDYCIACGYCDRKGKCIIKDDMTPLYDDFDIVIITARDEHRHEGKYTGEMMKKDTIDYFKKMSEETGMPYQNIINYYLLECVKEKKHMEVAFTKHNQ